MKQLEGLFEIRKPDGTPVDTFRHLSEHNHSQITNNSGVLFDGYTLEAHRIFEEKLQKQTEVAMFIGLVVNVIR